MSTPAGKWSELHHGIDPSGVPMLGAWLGLMWAVARRLRGVPPTAVTVLGVVLALDAVLLAERHPAWAAVAVVLAAICDGLDGAIAVIADRATRSGAVDDAVADRLADLAFAAVLWRVGVPLGLAAVCGALAVGVDGLRRLRGVPDRITVGERPSWTICASLAAVSAAVSDADWPALVCAGVWIALGFVAVGQLLRG
jgi:CDP-diacylglycerol--glycerol-3-phosphate 3-phosphatidyltransferase